MTKDAESGELKPEIKENSIEMVENILGSSFVDLRKLHLLKEKKVQNKFKLFPA